MINLRFKFVLFSLLLLANCQQTIGQNDSIESFVLKNETKSYLHLYILDQVLYGHPVYLLPDQVIRIPISSPSYIVFADDKQYYCKIIYDDTVKAYFDKTVESFFLKSTLDSEKSKVYNELFKMFGTFKPRAGAKNNKSNLNYPNVFSTKSLNEKRLNYFNNNFYSISEINKEYFKKCLFYTQINEFIEAGLTEKRRLPKSRANNQLYIDSCNKLLKYFGSNDSVYSLEYSFAAWNILQLIGNVDDIESIKKLVESCFSGKTKQFLLTRALLNNIDFNYNVAKKNIYLAIRDSVTNIYYLSEIEERIHRHDTIFAKEGNLADKIIINQSGVRLKLSDIMIGNGIKIIDFYASWCVPCIKEFEKYDLLIKKYRNAPIEFIFISMDRTKRDWLVFSKRYAFLSNSNNYYLPENFKSTIALDYRIREIPHHVIFDSKNHLFNSNQLTINENIINNLINNK